MTEPRSEPTQPGPTQPGPTQSGPTQSGPAPTERTDQIERTDGPDRTQRSLDAIDKPLDDVPLRQRLRRSGTARSTKILLGLVLAVVLFGLGALVGRATAPATGPGSEPPAVGVVDGVAPTPDGPIVTVRGPDGTLTTVRTTAGTVVAVPRPGGPGTVGVGQQVTITSERGNDGSPTATRIDVTG